MNKLFGNKYSPLTICYGKIHYYLGMNIDYYFHEKLKITILDHIAGFLSEIPSSLKGDIVNSAPHHLFELGYDSPMKQPTDSNIYYHHVMQNLWLDKRSRPYLLPPLSYLNTCVQSPNIHDWKKLARTCKYIYRIHHIPLILEYGSINLIKWYIDVAFVVHHNMIIYTGMEMMMVKGCIYGASGRQNINTNSSTE